MPAIVDQKKNRKQGIQADMESSLATPTSPEPVAPTMPPGGGMDAPAPAPVKASVGASYGPAGQRNLDQMDAYISSVLGGQGNTDAAAQAERKRKQNQLATPGG